MEHITAIVLAAGRGKRMQSDIPKQFLELAGKPVLYYSLKCFEESPVDDMILVTGAEDITYCREQIVDRFQLKKVKQIVAGGSERYWSVKNGLDAAKGADFVLIHDGARPCISQKIVLDSIEEVKSSGACTVGVPAKDTIKVVDTEGFGIETPPRETLWQIQTPQSFCYKELCEAYVRMAESGDTDITDDTMIIERYLHKRTRVIMGDYRNLKITTPEDLQMAEAYLA